MILFSLMQPTYFNLLIAVYMRSKNSVLPMAIFWRAEVSFCLTGAALYL
jgi:hypothetical protein